MGEMTNEQAVRWLKDLLKSDLPMEQYETALEKGIEALKQSGDLISREETLTAFADYVGSGMSMNDYDALWDIVVKMPPVKQEPKFIAKSDGTIEQIKNCNDCIFKKEWEKIGKLLSVVLEKQTEQEPKTGHWVLTDDDFVYCSECEDSYYARPIDASWYYCPHCGVKMESEG